MTGVIEIHLPDLRPQSTLNHTTQDDLTNPYANPESAKSETGSSQSAPIDADSLLTRCFGKPEFACLLLDQLEVSVLPQLEAIRLHLQHRDPGAVAEVAHSLKGAAGILCAESLAQLAARVEGASRSASFEELADAVHKLAMEVQRCLHCLPMLRDQIFLRTKPRRQ